MRVFVFFCAALAALDAQPSNDPKAWYTRGRQYSQLSVQAFEQLLKTSPESGYVLALLGDVKARERQYTAALYAYNEAAKRTPRLRGVRSGIADIYVALGKPTEAGDAETAEQKLGPPDCVIEKLYCEFTAGRFENVVRSARLKKNAAGLYWLTRAYNELAVQAFSELGHLPESRELHEFKGRMLREQGQFRESADEWRAVLKLAPGNRTATHELATSLYLSKDYKSALAELQAFQKADPLADDLNFFVGDGLLQTEQVEQAVPYLEAALKSNPKLLPAHASLGLCYSRMGELGKAIPHLKAALALDNDGSLHYQLARAYQATGQPALAKAMMDQYQKLHKPAAATDPAQ